jgi:hypothetical protein
MAVVMASLLASSLISNHPVVGSIIVIKQSHKGSDPFRLMVYGPMSGARMSDRCLDNSLPADEPAKFFL